MNVVCIAVDRLRADCLGCYGNTWISTSCLDGLASSGFVFDFFLADALTLPELYRSLWTGAHALTSVTGDEPCLPMAARLAGWKTKLLTDELLVAEHPLSSNFEERIVLPGCDRCEQTSRDAESVDQTQTAALMAAVAEVLQNSPERLFLWVHSQGMAGPWDAPLEYRQRHADPEDPPPPTFFQTPAVRLDKNADPDLLLGFRQAYAGQVALLDEQLGMVIEMLRESGSLAETLLVILGIRGFPLGNHGIVGAPPDAACSAQSEPLWGDSLHVPLLLHWPASQEWLGLSGGTRCQGLVQPADVAATLRFCLDSSRDAQDRPAPPIRSTSGQASPWGQNLLPMLSAGDDELRDRACSGSADGSLALRTASWFLRVGAAEATGTSRASDEEFITAEPLGPTSGCPGYPPPAVDSELRLRTAELYVKPDDRHELNQIAGICPQIVQEMLSVLTDTASAWRTGTSPRPLPEETRSGV